MSTSARTSAWTLNATATALLICAVALPLSACKSILLGTEEPPLVYDLSPKSTFTEDLPKVDWQLAIDIPESPASLNSSRIALKPSNTSIDYFAGVIWSDAAPKLVQSRLVESFDNTNKIISVARESAALRSDFLLLTDLREFTAVYESEGTAPTIQVRLNAKLIKMPQRDIVAGKTFFAKVPAKADQMEAIIEAFDEALGKVLKRTVVWTLKHPGTRNHRRRYGG